MKVNIEQIRPIVENIIRQSLNEGLFNEYMYDYDEEEEEMSPVEEYLEGYPNSDFHPENLTKDDVINWCQNVGDFLYIYNGFSGWRLSAANSSEIVNEIISDIENCEYLEPTHEIDYILTRREDEFYNRYVSIIKVNLPKKIDSYYIVYQIDR